eukprot:scaffold5296_cov163-Amphora_coffeaeformis.AAC.10
MQAEGEKEGIDKNPDTEDDSSSGKKRKAPAEHGDVSTVSPPVKQTKTTSGPRPQGRPQIHMDSDRNYSSTATTTSGKMDKSPPGLTSPPKKRKRGRPPKSDKPSWEYFYFRLGVFKQKHGHCRIPTSSSNGERKDPLSQWAFHQRSKQGLAALTEDQKAALDALGFIWDPKEDEFNRQWEGRFAQLVAYKEKHGTTIVPVKEETGLGRWASTQRDAHTLYVKKKSGQLQKDIESGKTKPPKKCRIMTEEHYQKLKSINFVFSIYQPGGGWDSKYEELKEYRAQYGDCKVPQHWKKNKGLGKFVARQRYLYCLWEQGKFDNNPLTQERIGKLNSLGFHWGSFRPNTWKDPQTEEAKRKVEEARAQPNNRKASLGPSVNDAVSESSV